ncbi:MAG: D-alanyl-D-alanine carboxypeptidase [Actinobacteria bacterium]|nr:D-alanyl-D-alanine carboxypeptidase [Actinomycetota bacterium]
MKIKKSGQLFAGVFFKKLAIFLLIFIFSFLLSSIILYMPGGLIAGGHVYADSSNNIEDNISKLDDNEINLTADAALIMNYDTGRILWEKNSDKKLYPASTTKLLTAIVARENIKNLDEIITISKNASGRNNSFFSFKRGDKISLRDLMKAALINSNNNATIALAEFVSGKESDFVKLMNEKAKELGANDTFFQNTNGLDSDFPDHKTTARDLAIIARYFMKDPFLRELVSTKEDKILINNKEVDIFNTNILLFFDYIKGIKTGFTENAGYCIVLYSEWNGIRLISVVLKSAQDQRNADILKLINWANDNYKNLKIVDSKKVYKTIKISKQSDDGTTTTNLYMDVIPDADFYKIVNINDKITIVDNINKNLVIPVKKNQVVGSLVININNQNYGKINLISKDSIELPVVKQEPAVEKRTEDRNVSIFSITFYFRFLIFIIIKNLFLKGR